MHRNMVFEERLIRIRDAFVTFEMKFSMADKDPGSPRQLSKTLAPMLRIPFPNR